MIIMRRVIDKTYLTKSGKDIRSCKMEGLYTVRISEKNEVIANKRIKIAEVENAKVARNAMRYVAK